MKMITPRSTKSPKILFCSLTLGELEAGFVVSMVPLFLSIFMFFIEWMLTAKDLMFVLFAFQKYFDGKNQEQLEHIKVTKANFALWQANIQEQHLGPGPAVRDRSLTKQTGPVFLNVPDLDFEADH